MSFLRSNLRSKAFWGLGLAALVALAVFFNLPQTAYSSGSDSAVVKATATITAGPAEERTVDQMLADEAARAAQPPALQEAPFRPTMSAEAYQAAKAIAAMAPAGEKGPLAPATPPLLKTINFSGDSNTGWAPPDTMGCVGKTQYVQVVNDTISVYKKANPGATSNLIFRIKLNTLFNYTAQNAFDPQVVFDPVWNRWIVCAPTFAESPDVMYFHIAISKTLAAKNGVSNWWIYRVNMVRTAGDFFDYPKVGFDQDAVIFTANNFNPGYTDSRFFAVSKALLYNGLFWSVPYFTGFTGGTIIPPKVLDNNGHAYLLSAAAGDNKIVKYDLTEAGRSNASVTTSNIPVTAFTVPPDATQPGTTATLDTMDCRFVNMSTQVGTSVFNTHTVNFSGYPTCRFYELNGSTNTVVQDCLFYASGTSNDFNVSLAANTSKDVFFTFTSTDRPAGINAQVRFAGRRNTANLSSVGVSPTVVKGSLSYLNGFRWGDYSCVNIDPAIGSGLMAWGTNEWIANTDEWAGWRSQIFRMGY